MLLAANFVVGLWGGDFNARAREKRAAAARLNDADRALKAARQSTSPEYEEARGRYRDADAMFQPLRFWMTLHMLLGSAASLMAILVSSITVTYFIGTSRWCKEVCDTYKLPASLAERSTRLKRSTFPWALVAIVMVIAIVGLGAAADPSGANFEHSQSLVMPHYLAAIAGLVLIGWSFWVQSQRIAENYVVIEDILAEVRQIREQKETATSEEGWVAT